MDDEKPRWFTIDPKRESEELRRAYAKAEASNEKRRQAEEELLQALAEEGIDLADYMPRQRTAPCPNCRTKTSHRIVHVEGRGLLLPIEPFPPLKGQIVEFEETFEIISCDGCGCISFAHSYVVSRGSGDGTNERWVDYYPSPQSRQQPWWLSPGSSSMNSELRNLCAEIYEALDGGQRQLTAMGIRALLEQVMVTKVSDQGTFAKNLDAFCEQGFVSPVQRDAIKHVLEVGHAAIHRRFVPNQSDLNTALDIVEGVLAAIYVHPNAAAGLSDRVPMRTPTGKVIPWRRVNPDAFDKGED
jgi:hypothetical protein